MRRELPTVTRTRTAPALRGWQRRILAVASIAAPLAIPATAALGAPGCGGTKGAPVLVQEVAPESDPGSGPIDCNVAYPYDLTTVEDFEFGAATGWYTNNEVCYPWTQAQAECADAGYVCYPGSAASPNCQVDGGQVPIYSTCFGNGPVDCTNPHALDACAALCASIQPSPPFSADQLPAALIPGGGRCGSRYALHVVGGPFQNWGGNVGTRFATPFDASSYDGVAVWMRTAPGFANNAKIAIGDKYTDSQYNMYPVDGQAQYCNPNPNCQVQAALGNTNCFNSGCDKFGAYTPLDENWRLFVLPFAEMRQGGWGSEVPRPDLSALLSIEVDYVQGSWDFWIDDIAFYRNKHN